MTREPAKLEAIHQSNNQIATPICVSVISSGGIMCERASPERQKAGRRTGLSRKFNIRKTEMPLQHRRKHRKHDVTEKVKQYLNEERKSLNVLRRDIFTHTLVSRRIVERQLFVVQIISGAQRYHPNGRRLPVRFGAARTYSSKSPSQERRVGPNDRAY